MSDYFARIGLVLNSLVENSTLHGPAKETALALCTELQAADDNIGEIINERVTAGIDAISGRITAVEDDHRVTKDVVFSEDFQEAVLAGVGTGSDEETKLKALFNGADPKAFDHDGNGAAGGSLTKAEIVQRLTDLGVDVPSGAKKPELQKLLEDSVATAAAADAAPTEDPAAAEQSDSSETAPAEAEPLQGEAAKDSLPA